ncbi:lysM and putative peptidoglycan-binding domain-containing protein 1 [Clinocottus analis]|uniref:lysM and putative peptidoglycan-binding domain-containing protein 1 n=1 Tax=Clinocottus analis TaxID=304258 RepID=UPI0035C0E6FE
MSGERAPAPAGKNGLLCGNRSKSYGSLVRSPLSPVRQRRVEHNIQPEDTLQGLSLKYGVSMEQIKRANRLYTNESIFLKKSLSIPVPSDLDLCSNWVDLVAEDVEEEGSGKRASATNRVTGISSERKPNDGKERPSDLTPVDFLKRLDGLISQSKQAVTKGCQDAEKRVVAIEAACSSGTSDWRPLTRSQSVSLSPRVQQQQTSYVAVPLTVTKLTKKLRDREDEIFQL